MLRFLLTCCFASCLYTVSAQETPITAEERAALDSMFENDEFIKMLGEKADTSFIDISMGVSNGVFSLKNNSLNAEQATTNKLFYTASVGYYHKSGFGITAGCFFASDSNRVKVFQYAISPSYGYYSKKISAGISYTRYITGTSTSFEVNPYKNDFYGSLVFKKLWIRPGIGMGYSIGRTKEYFDSVVTFIQPPRTITITDTITSTLSSFSLSISASHSWSFRNVLFNNDEIELQPCIMANGSNQKLKVSHSGSLNHRRPTIQNLLKAIYGDGSTKQKFSLQSVGFLFNIAYGKGQFLMLPQLYLDYYLHDTPGKKLSVIYSFGISYAF